MQQKHVNGNFFDKKDILGIHAKKEVVILQNDKEQILERLMQSELDRIKTNEQLLTEKNNNRKLFSEIAEMSLYFNNQITGKDEYIANLVQQIADKNKYFDSQLDGKDTYISNLLYQVSFYTSLINKIRKDVTALQRKIEDTLCLAIKLKSETKIVLYGSDEVLVKMKNILKSNIQLSGCISTSPGSTISTLSTEDLIHYEFDYLILADQTYSSANSHFIEHEMTQCKIIDLYDMMRVYFTEYFGLNSTKCYFSYLNYRMKAVRENCDYIIGVSGLSYAFKGISEKNMKYNCIKLSAPSQDLYYDLKVLTNVLKQPAHFKYWIIGLAYYSFDFDIKYGSDSHMILNTYYPLFQDAHGLTLPLDYQTGDSSEKPVNQKDHFLTHIFEEHDYPYSISKTIGFDPIGEYEKLLLDQSCLQRPAASFSDISENDRNRFAEQRAASHNHLNHPATTVEYSFILQNMLTLLHTHKIAPIFVVFPATSYYRKYFDPEIKERFYSIMDKLNLKNDFQLIDMFNSTMFSLDDFVDWDHLNIQGAI